MWLAGASRKLSYEKKKVWCRKSCDTIHLMLESGWCSLYIYLLPHNSFPELMPPHHSYPQSAKYLGTKQELYDLKGRCHERWLAEKGIGATDSRMSAVFFKKCGSFNIWAGRFANKFIWGRTSSWNIHGLKNASPHPPSTCSPFASRSPGPTLFSPIFIWILTADNPVASSIGKWRILFL